MKREELGLNDITLSETDARHLYEKSRQKARTWKDIAIPCICHEQRLPSVQIKTGRVWSIVTMICDPARYTPPDTAIDEYSNAILAHGIKVRDSHWHGNSREIWIERVPNAVADELGFALFQAALAYRPEVIEQKSMIEIAREAMLSAGRDETYEI